MDISDCFWLFYDSKYNDDFQKLRPHLIEADMVVFATLMDYLGWTSMGEVVASGVWTAGNVRNTDYPQQAYQLGKSI